LTIAGAQIVSQKYAMIACFSVFIYDYFLTLDREIKYIWRRQFTFVSFAYYVIRYFAMGTFIFQVFALYQ